jgi:hypothetical protein
MVECLLKSEGPTPEPERKQEEPDKKPQQLKKKQKRVIEETEMSSAATVKAVETPAAASVEAPETLQEATETLSEWEISEPEHQSILSEHLEPTETFRRKLEIFSLLLHSSKEGWAIQELMKLYHNL